MSEAEIRPFLEWRWNGAKKIYELDCGRTSVQVKGTSTLGCNDFFKYLISEYINDFFNKKKSYPKLDTEFEKNRYLNEIMTKFTINSTDITTTDIDPDVQINEILKTYIETHFFDNGEFAVMVNRHKATQAQSGRGYRKKRSRSKSSKKRKSLSIKRKKYRKGRTSKKGRKSRK